MGRRLTSIAGYGCITAVGADAQTGYNNLKKGLVRNTVFGSNFFPGDFRAPMFQIDSSLKTAAIKDYHLFNLPDDGGNRTIQLALSAIVEALGRAELTLGQLQTMTVGIALGTTVGCTFHNEEYYVAWRDREQPEPGPIYKYLNSNLATSLQSILGVTGPRLVVTNACASGTDAIGIAKRWLEAGICDVALAGGADELSRIASNGFKSLMLVSPESCRPFDADRKGLNLGEGAGIFLLESEENLLKRNGVSYGRVLGYGAGGDAHHPTAPHPSGKGLQKAVGQALSDAGTSAQNISFINGHGTGTPSNDIAETNGLAECGFQQFNTPVVSTKGVTGHTLGAAGGVEAVYTLVALNESKVSGTVGCRNIDAKLTYPVLPEGEQLSLKSRLAISQSLAFGGGNSALVIEGIGK